MDELVNVLPECEGCPLCELDFSDFPKTILVIFSHTKTVTFNFDEESA